MKDLIGSVLQRIDDYLLERTIKRLQRDYLREMTNGRLIVAKAVYRGLVHAVEGRSEGQWARLAKKIEQRMDPHARAGLSGGTRA